MPATTTVRLIEDPEPGPWQGWWLEEDLLLPDGTLGSELTPYLPQRDGSFATRAEAVEAALVGVWEAAVIGYDSEITLRANAR